MVGIRSAQSRPSVGFRHPGIVRALVPIKGKLVETEPKTKRGRRLIALDAETVAVLREQAAQQLVEQQRPGDEWVDSGRVFTQESGAELHPERISALFARLVRAAALPHIPLHGLRHTYASLALAKGVNPAIVSRRRDMPPWPSPWTSTPTCCPRSMPRRRRSSPRSTLTEARWTAISGRFAIALVAEPTAQRLVAAETTAWYGRQLQADDSVPVGDVHGRCG